jgi:hypothetical protein
MRCRPEVLSTSSSREDSASEYLINTCSYASSTCQIHRLFLKYLTTGSGAIQFLLNQTYQVANKKAKNRTVLCGCEEDPQSKELLGGPGIDYTDHDGS